MLRAGWAAVLVCLLVACAAEPEPKPVPSGPPPAKAPAAPPVHPDVGGSAPQDAAAEASVTSVPMIKAAVRPERARAGDPITVAITVQNPGPEVMFAPDPRGGGGSLVLRLKPPAGEERVITLGEPAYGGGVKPRLVNLRIPPGEKQTIDFELGQVAPIATVGRYGLVLEYAWKAGEKWRSPELGFTVLGS